MEGWSRIDKEQERRKEGLDGGEFTKRKYVSKFNTKPATL